MAEQAICSAAALPAGGRTGNLLWRRSGAYGRTGNLLWRRSGAYGRTGNLLCYPLCRLWQNRQFALPPPLPRFELNIKLKIPSAAALPAAGRTGNLLCLRSALPRLRVDLQFYIKFKAWQSVQIRLPPTRAGKQSKRSVLPRKVERIPCSAASALKQKLKSQPP